METENENGLEELWDSMSKESKIKFLNGMVNFLEKTHEAHSNDFVCYTCLQGIEDFKQMIFDIQNSKE